MLYYTLNFTAAIKQHAKVPDHFCFLYADHTTPHWVDTKLFVLKQPAFQASPHARTPWLIFLKAKALNDQCPLSTTENRLLRKRSMVSCLAQQAIVRTIVCAHRKQIFKLQFLVPFFLLSTSENTGIWSVYPQNSFFLFSHAISGVKETGKGYNKLGGFSKAGIYR